MDEDVLANIRINLIKTPVNIDRQIMSGMQSNFASAATTGTLQAVLINSLVQGLSRGRSPASRVIRRKAAIIASPRAIRTPRAPRYKPSRHITTGESHGALRKSLETEWGEILRTTGGTGSEFNRQKKLFLKRSKYRIGSYHVDRVLRGETSLDNIIGPRPGQETPAAQAAQAAPAAIAAPQQGMQAQSYYRADFRDNNNLPMRHIRAPAAPQQAMQSQSSYRADFRNNNNLPMRDISTRVNRIRTPRNIYTGREDLHQHIRQRNRYQRVEQLLDIPNQPQASINYEQNNIQPHSLSEGINIQDTIRYREGQ